LITGTLSMTVSDSHTKYHWPPERSSDLLGDTLLKKCTLNSLSQTCDLDGLLCVYHNGPAWE